MLHCIPDWAGAIGQDDNQDEGLRPSSFLNALEELYETLKKS